MEWHAGDYARPGGLAGSGRAGGVAGKFRLTQQVDPEDSLHATAADLLDRWLRPPAIWTTFPAGGYELGPRARGRLVRLGLKPGLPDILAWYMGRCVGLELKNRLGKRLASQVQMHQKLVDAGVAVYVCRTPEAVLDALNREGFPIQTSILKAMLQGLPYQPAEKITYGDPYYGETTVTRSATAATACSAAGAA